MNSFIPVSDVILNSSFNLFNKVSAMMLGLVGVIFIIRIVSLQVRFSSIYDYGILLKDIIQYFMLLSLFPFIVKLIYGMSENLALKISYSPTLVAQTKFQEFITELYPNFIVMKMAGKIGDFLILNIAEGAYSIFTALLLSIAPVFIFMSTVLGFEKGLSTYFSAIISISLWPVVWNLIGLLGRELFSSYDNSTLTVITYYVIIQFFQLLSPIFCLFLLKSLSPSGAVSKVVGLGAKL